MTKKNEGGGGTTGNTKKAVTSKRERAGAAGTPAARKAKSGSKARARATSQAKESKPIVVKHEPVVPEGLPKKYFLKSTFNTHDIMHAPVEKTLKMLDKILAGERLFTM